MNIEYTKQIPIESICEELKISDGWAIINIKDKELNFHLKDKDSLFLIAHLIHILPPAQFDELMKYLINLKSN